MSIDKYGYENYISGRPTILPVPGVWHLACCDCGLDHLVVFSPDKKGTIEIKLYRDDHMTKVHRKKSKFECKPRK